MAQMTNTITIEGNLVEDPDLRFTANGKAVVKGRIASSRTFEAGGEEKEDTVFISFDLWGRSAEVLAERYTKGDRITITGRLAQDSWETEDGQRRTAYKVVAYNVSIDALWSRKLQSDAAPAAEPAPVTDEIVPDDAPF